MAATGYMQLAQQSPNDLRTIHPQTARALQAQHVLVDRGEIR